MTKLIVLVGLSGSGKSTYAAKLLDEFENDGKSAVVISSDSVRDVVWGSRRIQDNPAFIFEICQKSIVQNLHIGRNVIFDATNLRFKDRMNLLEMIEPIEDVICECHVVVTKLEECIDNDMYREFSVGEEVIQKQVRKFQIPFEEEGWDDIKLVKKRGTVFDTNQIYSISYSNFYDVALNFDQHTPYHNLTLLEHAEKHHEFISNYVRNAYIDELSDEVFRVYDASFLHDYGKIMGHTEDENGVWHYYGHAEIGAYQVLTDCIKYTYDNESLQKYFDEDELLRRIVFYINYHMLPFDWQTDKVKNKYKKIFGEEKYNALMLMHEADKQGKRLEGDKRD